MSPSSPSFAPDTVARIASRDGSLYSHDAEVAADAVAFMGWTDLAARAEALLPEIERLAADVRSEPLTDVVLLGMGGSSLASLVIGTLLGDGSVRLHVLDTVSPVTIAAALAETDPATTLHLVSSKSGGTVEPNALYAIFRARADAVLGREKAGERFVAVTDPGSSLESLASTDAMLACVLTPPDVGGRYSALTAFGLLPAALIGVDVRRLVAQALETERLFTHGDGDTRLAEYIARSHAAGADKLSIVAPADLRVFGLWIEQLVAESLGKRGIGVVPVVEHGEPTEWPADRAVVELHRSGDTRARSADAIPERVFTLTFEDPHELGGWFVLWEYSVALVGIALDVNPFDQPNVAEAKAATNAVLDGSLDPPAPQAEDGGVRITFAGGLAADGGRPSVADAVRAALASLRPRDYVALLTYLPDDEELLRAVRDASAVIRDATGAATCFELGPRYLHSTGQLHKGGPNTGVFIMITTRDETDIEVPGWPFGLRELHVAQAEGDLTALAAHGRRVLRLDLPDASAQSIAAVAHALRAGAADPTA